jgi:hypothetical protein
MNRQTNATIPSSSTHQWIPAYLHPHTHCVSHGFQFSVQATQSLDLIRTEQYEAYPECGDICHWMTAFSEVEHLATIIPDL